MAEDLGDINLDKPGPDVPDLVTRPARRPATVVWISAGVLILALAGGYVYLRRPPPPSASVQVKKPVVAVPQPRAEPGEQISLPPLDETDPLVRDLVSRLSSHPAVAAWLTTDGLIQNFVVVTSRIAN